MEQQTPPEFPESDRPTDLCVVCNDTSRVVQNPCRRCGWYVTVENFTDDDSPCIFNAGLSATESRRILECCGSAMLARYRASDDATRARLRRLYIDGDPTWPSTGPHNWACPCCGYHTFYERFADDSHCTACGYSVQLGGPMDGPDVWNDATWICLFLDYPRGHPLRVGSVERARRRYESQGHVGIQYSYRHQPEGSELPRHDWANDPRVFCDPEWRSLDASNRDDLDL